MVQLYPGLYQPQLLAGQLACQYLAIFDADGSLKLSVLGMNMRQIVPLAIDEVQASGAG